MGGEERGGASPAAQLPSVWKNLCNTQAGLVCEQVGVVVGWDGAEGWAGAPFDCVNVTAVPPEGHRSHISVIKSACEGARVVECNVVWCGWLTAWRARIVGVKVQATCLLRGRTTIIPTPRRGLFHHAAPASPLSAVRCRDEQSDACVRSQKVTNNAPGHYGLLQASIGG